MGILLGKYKYKSNLKEVGSYELDDFGNAYEYSKLDAKEDAYFYSCLWIIFFPIDIAMNIICLPFIIINYFVNK